MSQRIPKRRSQQRVHQPEEELGNAQDADAGGYDGTLSSLPEPAKSSMWVAQSWGILWKSEFHIPYQAKGTSKQKHCKVCGEVAITYCSCGEGPFHITQMVVPDTLEEDEDGRVSGERDPLYKNNQEPTSRRTPSCFYLHVCQRRIAQARTILVDRGLEDSWFDDVKNWKNPDGEAPNPVLFDKLGSENTNAYEDFDYLPEILGEEVQEE